MVSLRENWKEHKTGITFFSGALLSLLYSGSHFLWRVKKSFYGIWTENKSFYDIIELTSLFVPVAAAIVTLVAGGIDMSLWFSDNARKSLKRKVKKAKKETAKREALWAKREALWIEWAENGKESDKMPSKVDPIEGETIIKTSEKKK